MYALILFYFYGAIIWFATFDLLTVTICVYVFLLIKLIHIWFIYFFMENASDF